MEKSAIRSGIIAGGTGVLAGLTIVPQIKTNNAINSAEADSKYAALHADDLRGKDHRTGSYSAELYDGTRTSFSDLNQISSGGYLEVPERVTTLPGGGKVTSEAMLKSLSAQSITDFGHANAFSHLSGSLSRVADIMSVLCSILFGAMWGLLITSGISTVRTISKAHKANVIRREEILKQLLSDRKTLKEDFASEIYGVLLID